MANENIIKSNSKKIIRAYFVSLIFTIILMVMLLAIVQHKEIKAQENTTTTTTQVVIKQPITLSCNAVILADINETTTKVTTTKKKTTKKKKKTKTYKVPAKSSFKSYTNYHCLNRKSPQWKMQKKATTDKNGLRKIDDDYLVAMGSYYSKKLGERFEITLSSGNTFTVRICDFKSDKHTNKTHQYTTENGCAIEFYVDDNLNKNIKKAGSVSALKKFKGKITKIEKLGEK